MGLRLKNQLTKIESARPTRNFRKLEILLVEKSAHGQPEQESGEPNVPQDVPALVDWANRNNSQTHMYKTAPPSLSTPSKDNALPPAPRPPARGPVEPARINAIVQIGNVSSRIGTPLAYHVCT